MISESLRAIVMLIRFVILAIGLFLLLYLGGCAVIVGSAVIVDTIKDQIEDQSGRINYYQAANSELPEDVEFLVSQSGIYPFYNHPVLQNESGRYALTTQGFYNFSNGEYTLLTCSLNEPDFASYRNTEEGTPLYKYRNYHHDSFWLTDELFLWQGCLFEAKTLKPGKIIKYPSFAEGDAGEAKANVQKILQQIKLDKIYYVGEEDIYFISDTPDSSPVIHIVQTYHHIREQVIQETNLPGTSLPFPYKGRSISENTERLSPDEQLKAWFDGQNLVVKRIDDGVIVAQVSAQEFHKIWFNLVNREQYMEVYGWTDDSQRIVFSIQTNIKEPLVIQTFVLNIRKPR